MYGVIVVLDCPLNSAGFVCTDYNHMTASMDTQPMMWYQYNLIVAYVCERWKLLFATISAPSYNHNSCILIVTQLQESVVGHCSRSMTSRIALKLQIFPELISNIQSFIKLTLTSHSLYLFLVDCRIWFRFILVLDQMRYDGVVNLPCGSDS